MDHTLGDAIAPVLLDVRATRAPEPRVEASDWTEDQALPAAMLWSADGSGVGIFVRLDDPQAARVVHAAAQVQEWVLEESSAGAGAWPPCPLHAGTHPLTPALVEGDARWTCASERTVLARVGGLVEEPPDGPYGVPVDAPRSA